MPRTGVTTQLAQHFFRRFFDNDVLDSDGEALTTVVRALAVMAAPGLLLAFFLQNSYPQRSTWGRVEDQYFFVLFSFVAMAGLALFEWEMLFPERLDFLVLTPLPLRQRHLLLAKGLALGGFFALFLVASNLFGVWILPAVSKQAFWRMLLAHTLSVGLAGAFAALAVLDTGAVLLCLFPPALFRKIMWCLQALGTAALGLLLIAYARFGDGMERVLQHGTAAVRYVPPIWFLGIYQQLLRGSSAQPFVPEAAHRAWLAMETATALAVLMYPLAWERMQRMAIQGENTHAYAHSSWWRAPRNRVLTSATERAVFSFVGKTLGRSSRYQVYLAMYCGVGLALAVSCSVGYAPQARGKSFLLSTFGLHAVLPLLLFWTVAGLHNTFAVPQNLPARWLFRVAGVDPDACVQATRRWVATVSLVLVALSSALCASLGWGARSLLVQAVWNACFGLVLVESFFVAQRGVPFTRPRAPGKTNLPAVLTLYIGVLPPLLFSLAWIETRMERSLLQLAWPILVSLLLWGLLRWIRARLLWTGEEGDTADGDFQLLGLSGQLRA